MMNPGSFRAVLRKWRAAAEFDAIDPRLVQDAGLDRSAYCGGAKPTAAARDAAHVADTDAIEPWEGQAAI